MTSPKSVARRRAAQGAPVTDRQNTPGHWPAMSPELVAIGDLRKNPRNSKTHPPAQIEQIATSLLRYGWTFPALAEDDPARTMLAGHARIEAAELLVRRGHAQFRMAPVVTARGWSPEERSAYIILDNKLSENGEWDRVMLASEVAILSDTDFDVSILGFTQEELGELLGAEPSVDEPEEEADAGADDGERPEIIHCPNCAHPFSILAKKPARRAKKAKPRRRDDDGDGPLMC